MKDDSQKDRERIEIITRRLMSCSDKLSKSLNTSLEAIEQAQKELQSILAGEQSAKEKKEKPPTGAIHGGSIRKARMNKYDRGD